MTVTIWGPTIRYTLQEQGRELHIKQAGIHKECRLILLRYYTILTNSQPLLAITRIKGQFPVLRHTGIHKKTHIAVTVITPCFPLSNEALHPKTVTPILFITEESGESDISPAKIPLALPSGP